LRAKRRYIMTRRGTRRIVEDERGKRKKREGREREE
jgi:hypothetical protein